MVVDLGTGDGRAVLQRAAAEPAALVIGIDAVAAAMAESSRRADRRGPANALFLAAGAEDLECTPLAGQVDVATVAFPWGSLLRGVVGLDGAALCGIASLIAPTGRLEVLASVIASDRLDGLDYLDASSELRMQRAWSATGLDLRTMRQATIEELVASGST